jgi:hypothetical protein
MYAISSGLDIYFFTFRDIALRMLTICNPCWKNSIPAYLSYADVWNTTGLLHRSIQGLVTMSSKAPYQPSLLRLLHGVSALLTLVAVISGYWIYNQFDGRWGRIDLPHIDAIMDLHHGIAGKATLVFVLLGLYGLTLGRHKLIQPSSLKYLTQVNAPVWWQSLHRLTNTFMLGGIVLAVLSGRQMNGGWLVQGDFAHGTYVVHLAAWGAIGLSFVLHLLMNVKIGGISLLLSIFSIKLRPNDMPKDWFGQIQKIWKRP